MKRLLLFLLLVPVIAFSQMKREQLTVKIDAAGHTAQALVYSPAGDAKAQQLPLLIWYGGQGQALYQKVNGVMQKVGKIDSDGLPAYLNGGYTPCNCYIYALQDDWASPTSPNIDYSLKNTIETLYPIDPTAIYDIGASFGGSASLAHAEEHTEYVSGVWSGSTSALQDSSLKKLKVLSDSTIYTYFWYGTKDTGPFPGIVKDYSSRLIALGAKVEVISEVAGHFDLQNVLTGKTLYSNNQNIYQKLLAHSKMPPVYVPPIVTAPPNKMLSVDTTNVLQIVIILKNGTIKSLLQ